MTNHTELFHPEHDVLTLPAATAAVFVEGLLRGDLEPVEIVRAGWPEFGWARLRYNLAACVDVSVICTEQIEDRFGLGRQISIRQLNNRLPPGSTTGSIPVFVGRIERIETTIDDDGEAVEIIARDVSAVLDRVTVYGRRLSRQDGSTVFLPGLDATFNPSGRPNVAKSRGTVEGKTYSTFGDEAGESLHWTYAEAIDYLLSEYLPFGLVHQPPLEQLRALVDGRIAGDLDVTGLSLLEALHRCCETAGIQFGFVPQLAETGPAQAIIFYRNGCGRCAELNCQPQSERLSVSRTNVAALQSTRNLYPLTRRYIGQGDFKTYESTFELVPAWDPALEDINYYKFSPSTNPDFGSVKDVYRKWCLNEAGDYTDPPYSRGEPYNFSKVFEGAEYSARRRRFWPALSLGSCGQSLGYFVEVSLDYGDNWSAYRHSFDNLLDECGIWLNSDQLDVDTWVACLKGALRVRITASVVSDARLTAIVSDGPVGSTAPVVDHVLTLPRRFRYRKVSPQSQFYHNTAAAPNEVDDSAALYAFVRQRSVVSPATIEEINVKTPSLNLHFQPGDRVTSSPESRDLFGCRRDNRSRVWIERAHIDFANQCTSLHLVRQRF
jgi:hypothetical protein